MDPPPDYKPVTLTAHRDRLINVFFAEDSRDVRHSSAFFESLTLDL